MNTYYIMIFVQSRSIICIYYCCCIKWLYYFRKFAAYIKTIELEVKVYLH